MHRNETKIDVARRVGLISKPVVAVSTITATKIERKEFQKPPSKHSEPVFLIRGSKEAVQIAITEAIKLGKTNFKIELI